MHTSAAVMLSVVIKLFLQLSFIPDFACLKFTETRCIYGLINVHSPQLLSHVPPYAQPLNLKGEQLLGPYVTTASVS